MDTCKVCNGIFDRSEKYVLCSGLCGKVFHPGCVGLNVTNFRAWTANVGLLWFCDTCRVNFNPIVMDREAVIIKTMRDLLLRVDSMDLRVGQLGENLKTLSSILTMPGSVRRESNISSRFHRLLASGTTMNDSAEFFNSIDRLNLDSSLLSNSANNTIADDEDPVNLTSVLLPANTYSNTTMTSSTITPTLATTSSTSATAVSSTTTATATTATATTATATTATATTATTTTATAAAAVTSVVVTAAAVTATSVTAATSPAATATVANATAAKTSAGITTAVTTTTTSLVGSISSGVASTSGSSRPTPGNPSADDTCRLRVVSKNRPRPLREPTDTALKSYYITPFHNGQSVEDIIEYLREVTNIDNSRINCVKLVPKNKNIEECTFVSFKLSVSDDLVSVVSDPFYWPDGVEVREFRPKNENVQISTRLT